MKMKQEKQGFFDLPKQWESIWQGMPSFYQEKRKAFQEIIVRLESIEDREKLEKLLDHPLTENTKCIWFPRKFRENVNQYRWVNKDAAGREWKPRYPIYVISKGRWESRLTSKALEDCGAPYHIVIEPQEYKQYAAVIDPEKILVLPFSNLGQGSIPARNWVWEHSLKSGAKRHWILDDNIRSFYRLWNNTKIRLKCPNMFRVIEDLSDRYENVGISGMHYNTFVPKNQVLVPFYLNTRIYSCILINNEIKHRWRGRYNEDTDLSLNVLKDGWCTILTTAFLAEKMATMRMKGGNTDELYKGDGRLLMAQELKKWHPDVTTIVQKWGRWQHSVDYRPFEKNKLILKPNMPQLDKPNEYGMRLIRVSADEDEFTNDKLLLIGQTPGKEDEEPLTGRIGKKLAELMGISYEEYLERTERMNVLDEYPGSSEGKGGLFPMKEARRNVKILLKKLINKNVVFLGKSTAKIFGHDSKRFFKWEKNNDIKYQFVVCPHPSRISTWWNDEKNMNRAHDFFETLMKEG